MSKFTEFIASPNFLIIFILIIIITCILIIRYQPGVNTKGDPDGSLNKDYYDRPSEWSSITPSPIRVKQPNGNKTGPLKDSDKCALYVYQNNFGLATKPNINTLFQDVYNDLAHLLDDKIPPCLNDNEVLAQHGKHTCINKTKNSCINAFGNYVPVGTEEEYSFNCGKNISPCPGVIGNLSFNFLFTPEFSLALSTRFLTIDTLVTSQVDYNQLEQTNGYYFQQGLFVPDDTNKLKSGQFLPRFLNQEYKNNSVRQQFKFIRYSYSQPGDSDSFAWTEDAQGPYVSIIYIPANAYLSARVENDDYQFIFYSLEGVDAEDTIQWFFTPPLDLNPQQITLATKYSEGYIKQLSTSGDYGPSSNSPGSFVLYDPNIPGSDNENFYQVNWYGFLPQYSQVKRGTIVKPILNNNDTNDNPIITNFVFNNSHTPIVNSNFSLTEYPLFLCKALTDGYTTDFSDFFNFNQSIVDSNNENYKSNEKLTIIYDYDNPKDGNLTASMDITLSFGQPINDSFAIGEVFYDNQVAWQVLDPYENVAIFDDNYFFNGGGVSSVTAVSLAISNTSDVKYKEAKQGLVNKINFDNIKYDYDIIKPGSYEIILDSNNTIEPSIPDNNYNNDEPASIVMIFSQAEDDRGNNISLLTEIDIAIQGSGYINNQTFGLSINQTTFPGSSGGGAITNLSLNTVEQIVQYSAVTLDVNNQAYNPTTDNIEKLKNGGFTIDENVINITNGILTLNENPYTLKATGDSGGFNYSIDDIIYLNELDQFGNSLLGDDYSPYEFKGNINNLAQLKVESSSVPSIGPSYRANYNLIRDPEPADGITLTKDALFYNFWQNGSGEYAPSPPQIAFIGDGLRDSFKNIIKTGSPQELVSIFSSSKEKDSNITNITNIKTIQFPELNYTGADKNNLEEIRSIHNTLGTSSSPVLGRFIPYSYFIPPVFQNGDGSIPTGQSDTAFYNNNFAQIVPYGIKNIYRRIFDGNDVPTI